MDGSCLRATIQISNDPSGHIIVSFPYDPLLVSKVKTIEGRRWHPAEKHRSFPKLDGMLEKILEVFGEGDVQIDLTIQTDSSKGKETPRFLRQMAIPLLPRPSGERVGVRGIISKT